MITQSISRVFWAFMQYFSEYLQCEAILHLQMALSSVYILSQIYG